jgi:C-terminal processing protease CtpA/Prc
MIKLIYLVAFLSLATVSWGQEAPVSPEARIVTSESLATGYSEQLGVADRLAGLSLLWSEARYNFANFDLVPDLDWDAHYRATIPRVLSAQSTAEYYQELRRFYAALEDGHTGVYMPQELRSRFYARPPVYTRLIEGRVMIYRVNSKKLQAMGLRAGQEILQIDGVGVNDYAAEKVRPFQSASTPQDLDVRVYSFGLLQGDAEEAVELVVTDAGQQRQEFVVPRAGYGDDDKSTAVAGAFSIHDLGDGILLLDIRSFNEESVLEAFTEKFEEISQAAGLIIDVRMNGGGNSGIGWGILAQLVDEPFPTSRWKTRLYRPAFRAWSRPEAWSWHEEEDHEVDPHGEHLYTGPVAVLSGPRTYSAAEDFLAAFRQANRGPIIGQASGGSTGQPLQLRLPGGGSARVCTKRDLFADGTEFVGVGVTPDITVQDTIADLRAGQDASAARAKQYLLNSLRE